MDGLPKRLKYKQQRQRPEREFQYCDVRAVSHSCDVFIIVLNRTPYTELKMINVVRDRVIVIVLNRILYTEHRMISVVCDTVPTMELTHNGFPQSL